MGLWDRIKKTLARGLKGAAGTVSKIREGLGSAINQVRSFTQGVVSRNAAPLQVAAQDLIRGSVAAQSRAAKAATRAQERLQAATRIHAKTARRALETQRVRAMTEALRVQGEAARKAFEAQKAIEDGAKRIKTAATNRETRLREDLAAAETIPKARETIEEIFNRAAVNTLLTGSPFRAQMPSKAQEVLDKITDTFGMQLTPGGPKHIVIIPGVDVKTALPGANRVAARRIGEVISGQGMKTIVSNFKKNPQAFLKNIGKLKPVDKAKFFKNLHKAPGGNTMARAIDRYETNKLFQAMTAAERRSWKQMAKKAPKWFFKLLGVGTAVMGTEFMIGWLRKEATEPLGIASWGAYEEKKWGELKKITEAQRKFQDTINVEVVSKILESFPILGPMFKVNREEQMKSNEFFARAAEEGLKNEPEATARLILAVSPTAANVYINGQFHGKGPRFEVELPPGDYVVLVDLKGYEAQSLDVSLDPKEIESHSVQLDVSAAETFRKWEKVSDEKKISVRDKYPDQYRRWTSTTPSIRNVWITNQAKPYKEWTPEARDEWKDWDQSLENKGAVDIVSTPPADVFIGGVDSGRMTPTQIELAPGSYDISLETPGHETWHGKAFIKAGRTEEIRAELKPRDKTEREEDLGYLSINTEPMGAVVIIDGIVQDYPTPTKVDLDPGTHDVIIRKKGYQDLEDTIVTTAGETVRKDYVIEEKITEDVYRVFVNSTPSGGKILVDGFFSGEWSDGYVDLLPGTYDISVQKTGYQEAEQEVEVP